jgi:hypothetical protein
VTLEQPALGHTGDELNSAVMLELQAICQLSNTGGLLRRQASNREEQLMLLRLQPGISRRLLTKTQELPELIAEFGERPVVALRQIQISIHYQNFSVYSLNGCA